MRKEIIIGLCILLLISSVTAISNKDRILQLLNNYEEECLEYEMVNIIEYEKQCLMHTDYGSKWEKCCCGFDKESWRQTRLFKNSYLNKTDKCVKWHLVRKEKD